MKKCEVCGEILPDSAVECTTCGNKFNVEETVNATVVESSSYTNQVAPNLILLERAAKGGETALIVSIVGFLLCCCSPVSIVSLVLSIVNIVSLNKLSNEDKVTKEYNKAFKNNLIALIISIITLVLFAISQISDILNPLEISSFGIEAI